MYTQYIATITLIVYPTETSYNPDCIPSWVNMYPLLYTQPSLHITPTVYITETAYNPDPIQNLVYI